MELTYVYVLVFTLLGACQCITSRDGYHYQITNYVNLISAYEYAGLYSTTAFIPKKNSSEAIQVDVAISLLAINNFDEVSGNIEIVSALNIAWVDETPIINSISFQKGSDDALLVSPSDIWTPNLLLVNAIGEDATAGHSDFLATFNMLSNQVVWRPRSVLVASCTPNVEFFPYDKQKCEFTFSVWGYDASEVTLAVTRGWDMSDYSENGEWSIEDSTTESYTHAGESRIKFSLSLSRIPLYAAFNILLPVVVLCALNCVVFLLPEESGERVGFSCTLFLSFMVCLNTVMDIMPRSSSPVSYLCFYLVVMMSTSAAMTLVTIMLSRVYHQPEKNKVPKWLSRVVTFIQCRCHKLRCCVLVCRAIGTKCCNRENTRKISVSQRKCSVSCKGTECCLPFSRKLRKIEESENKNGNDSSIKDVKNNSKNDKQVQSQDTEKDSSTSDHRIVTSITKSDAIPLKEGDATNNMFLFKPEQRLNGKTAMSLGDSKSASMASLNGQQNKTKISLSSNVGRENRKGRTPKTPSDDTFSVISTSIEKPKHLKKISNMFSASRENTKPREMSKQTDYQTKESKNELKDETSVVTVNSKDTVQPLTNGRLDIVSLSTASNVINQKKERNEKNKVTKHFAKKLKQLATKENYATGNEKSVSYVSTIDTGEPLTESSAQETGEHIKKDHARDDKNSEEFERTEDHVVDTNSEASEVDNVELRKSILGFAKPSRNRGSRFLKTEVVNTQSVFNSVTEFTVVVKRNSNTRTMKRNNKTRMKMPLEIASFQTAENIHNVKVELVRKEDEPDANRDTCSASDMSETDADVMSYDETSGVDESISGNETDFAASSEENEANDYEQDETEMKTISDDDEASLDAKEESIDMEWAGPTDKIDKDNKEVKNISDKDLETSDNTRNRKTTMDKSDKQLPAVSNRKTPVASNKHKKIALKKKKNVVSGVKGKTHARKLNTKPTKNIRNRQSENTRRSKSKKSAPSKATKRKDTYQQNKATAGTKPQKKSVRSKKKQPTTAKKNRKANAQTKNVQKVEAVVEEVVSEDEDDGLNPDVEWSDVGRIMDFFFFLAFLSLQIFLTIVFFIPIATS